MTVSPEAERAAESILKLDVPNQTMTEIALIIRDAIDKWHLKNSDNRIQWLKERHGH